MTRTDTRDRGCVVGISPDAALVMLHLGNDIKVLDRKSLSTQCILHGVGAVHRVDMWPPGMALVTRDVSVRQQTVIGASWIEQQSHELSRWDLATGRLRDKLLLQNVWSTGTAVLPAGPRVSVASQSGGAEIWDFALGRRILHLNNAGSGCFASCAVGRVEWL